jgi:MarR family transcriptional regulator, organic hydroperoxide resistance regulator
LSIYLSHEIRLMKNRRRDPPTTIPLELRQFLCFAIYSANHAFNRQYQRLLKDLGLTYPQFIALVLLWEEDNQTIGELGQKLFLQSNTLTPMLKRLETLGYITRRRDSEDERQVRINLTEEGRRLQMRASDIVRHVRHATGLQNNQIERLLDEIGALRKALEGHIPS